jgi:hypothetical protein
MSRSLFIILYSILFSSTFGLCSSLQKEEEEDNFLQYRLYMPPADEVELVKKARELKKAIQEEREDQKRFVAVNEAIAILHSYDSRFRSLTEPQLCRMQDLSAEKALKCDYEGEEMLDFDYKKARAFSELMDALSQLFPHSLSQVVK